METALTCLLYFLLAIAVALIRVLVRHAKEERLSK